MLTVLLMAESGSWMKGTSLLVRSSTTKMRMKGHQAVRASPAEMGSPAPAISSLNSSGTSASLWRRQKAKVMTSAHTAPTTSGRSVPMKRAAMISGMPNETAAMSATGTMPFMAFLPPRIPTMSSGVTRTKGNACSACVKASWMGSMPVMVARVAVGMPIEPNIVGRPLASRQARMAVMGFTPSAASMLAGIATAVPKPAMPSRKLPKHQPMRITSTRMSDETEQSIALIFSMAPVCTVRL